MFPGISSRLNREEELNHRYSCALCMTEEFAADKNKISGIRSIISLSFFRFRYGIFGKSPVLDPANIVLFVFLGDCCTRLRRHGYISGRQIS